MKQYENFRSSPKHINKNIKNFIDQFGRHKKHHHNSSSSSSNYEYLGCWNDTGNRAIPRQMQNVSSVKDCENIARENNAPLFGVQYYGQCFIGDDLDSAMKYGQATNCPSLGGAWNNQVYSTIKPGKVDPNMPKTAGPYKYHGCYNDTSNRAIPNYVGNVQNVEDCEKKAYSNGTNVFGLQYYGQCFIGDPSSEAKTDPIKNAEKYGKNNNNNDCPHMGGSWTNHVYIADANSIPPVQKNLQKVNFAEHFKNDQYSYAYYFVLKRISSILLTILFIYIIYHLYKK